MTHWDIVNGAKDHCLSHAVIVVSDVVIFAETCFCRSREITLCLSYLGHQPENWFMSTLSVTPSLM